MNKKEIFSGILILLICILVIGVVRLQYRRANTTVCIIKGTIIGIEDNIFTVVPDTSFLSAIGPS